MYVVCTYCLRSDVDQDLIAMVNSAPNKSALVRDALRAHQERASANALLREINERIREVRDMMRAGGAQTAASEEPAEAIRGAGRSAG